MKTTSVLQIFEVIGFCLLVYFGFPVLFPSKVSFEKLLASASSEQVDVIHKGKISSRVLSAFPRGTIITQSEILNHADEVKFPTIFPPDLDFPIPPVQSDHQKDSTAQAQRIALLENKIAACETELSLLKGPQTSNWEWGFEKLIALAIWFFGTIATTVVKHHTEIRFLKKNAKGNG